MPRLESNAADFKQYAETDLPDWFRTALLNNADNSPAGNSDLDAEAYNARAELGRVLFFDDRLSHNDTTACASCHVRENGFSDPRQFSVGFEGGLTGRHSMGLSNARFYQSGRFFWDERAATLEDQVLGPIQDPVEMGSNLPDLLVELQSTEFYPVLFQRAFGPAESGEQVVTEERLADALAQFVRSMVSYQSKFDQALAAETAGGRLSDVLSDSELNGHALFAQNCNRCHRGNAQIGSTPKNIGLNITADETGTPINGVDQGAGNGEFKVPSLRNLAGRDGFMHDGRFTTLEEVINFYSEGILNDPNLDPFLRRQLEGAEQGGFDYTDEEKADLLAFLNTLTDDVFLGTTGSEDLLAALFTDPFVDLTGDFNGDGVVDADDQLAFAERFGSGEEGELINAASYVAFRDNVGARWDDNQVGTLVAAAGVSVPEPGAFVLAATLLAATSGVRRRKRG